LIQIKNRKVYVESTDLSATQILVLNGDCVYTWKKNEKTGEKTCGVSQYITLMEGFAQMGSGDMSSFVSLLPSSTNGAVSEEKLQKVMSTCEKKTVNDTAFIVPKTVKFTQSDLLPLDSSNPPAP
jgi:hypothetical protein